LIEEVSIGITQQVIATIGISKTRRIIMVRKCSEPNKILKEQRMAINPGLCIRNFLPALRYGEAGIPKLNCCKSKGRGGQSIICNCCGATLFEYKYLIYLPDYYIVFRRVAF
jgi:hypothetical protein